MDWNGNEKGDWRDRYIDCQIYNDDKGGNGGGNDSGGRSSCSGCLFATIVIVNFDYHLTAQTRLQKKMEDSLL